MKVRTARASATCGLADSSARSARVRADVSRSTSDLGSTDDFSRSPSAGAAASASLSELAVAVCTLRIALRSARLIRPRAMTGSPLRSIVMPAPACAISAWSQTWNDARRASSRASAASRVVHKASLSASVSSALSNASISTSRLAIAWRSSFVRGRVRGRTRSLAHPSIWPWCICASTQLQPSPAKVSRISSMRSAARR